MLNCLMKSMSPLLTELPPPDRVLVSAKTSDPKSHCPVEGRKSFGRVSTRCLRLLLLVREGLTYVSQPCVNLLIQRRQGNDAYSMQEV